LIHKTFRFWQSVNIPNAKQYIPMPKKKNEILEKLRELCASRGATGIAGLAVYVIDFLDNNQ
jgi:hypothetical protein